MKGEKMKKPPEGHRTLRQIAENTGHVVTPKTMAGMIRNDHRLMKGAKRVKGIWVLPKRRAEVVQRYLNRAKRAIERGEVNDFNSFQRRQLRGRHREVAPKGWVSREHILSIDGALKPDTYIARAYKHLQETGQYPPWAKKVTDKWIFKKDHIERDAELQSKREEKDLIGAGEIAKMLGCSRRTVLNYMDQGRIPHKKIRTGSITSRKAPRTEIEESLPELRKQIEGAKRESARRRKGKKLGPYKKRKRKTPTKSRIAKARRQLENATKKAKETGPSGYLEFAKQVSKLDLPAEERAEYLVQIREALDRERVAAESGRQYRDHPRRKPGEILNNRNRIQEMINELKPPETYKKLSK
jgi:predicted DNA-binding transcriptional regulator AlpA